MPHSFKLSRRIARLRAPVFALVVAGLVACDSSDTLTPDSSTTPDAIDLGDPQDPLSSIEEDTPVPEDDAAIQLIPVDGPALAVAYAGGIPIGSTAQPNSEFNGRYNGALRNIHPQYLKNNLSAIKSRGGKVVLMMAGPDFLYKDADGHFSLTKWKARIDRYRNVDFDSYIKDGTLIAHYLIDEPNDPNNWNGKPIPGTTLDEMARYSKQLWPNMLTVVRTYPTYLEKWGPYRYVDAAWAQYVNRFGDPDKFIAQHVNSAQRQGLGLVVGLNILRGGVNKSKMTPTQIKDWGSSLLKSSYPCAFISWKYNSTYFSTSGVKSAMDYLRSRAENRSFRTCRG